MDPFVLRYCRFLHANYFKKYPFKETGKLSKLFDMILWGHEQAGRISNLFKKQGQGQTDIDTDTDTDTDTYMDKETEKGWVGNG